LWKLTHRHNEAKEQPCNPSHSEAEAPRKATTFCA